MPPHRSRLQPIKSVFAVENRTGIGLLMTVTNGYKHQICNGRGIALLVTNNKIHQLSFCESVVFVIDSINF